VLEQRVRRTHLFGVGGLGAAVYADAVLCGALVGGAAVPAVVADT
jgi:hypothetical protein